MALTDLKCRYCATRGVIRSISSVDSLTVPTPHQVPPTIDSRDVLMHVVTAAKQLQAAQQKTKAK